MDKIFTQGERFIDEHGRQRIFNGVNLCDKGRPNAQNTKKDYELKFDESLIIKLKQSGFTLIRLGLTWDAVEPEPNRYDEDYLNRVEDIADLCQKHGIYFFLDMHQDLYGGAVDTPADGAPMWACLTDGAKFHQTRFVWAEGYFFGRAIHNCFDHFWANDVCCGKPIQEYYCNMWKHVAERFKNHPALFGFDVMNEPFPGTPGGKAFRKLIAGVTRAGLTDRRVSRTQLVKDALKAETRHKVLDQFSDPDLFHSIVCRSGEKLIRQFDLECYSPFINKVAAAIREVTDNGIIIMENCYYSNLGIPCSTPAVTIHGRREEKQCFAPHGYDLMVDTPDYKYASNSRTGSIFDEHRRTQKRLNVPVLVGEWGGSGGNEGTEWLQHINYLLDKFDSNQWGQTYWCYSEGMFDSVVMQSLLRISPMAVSGTIDSYGVDRKMNTFSLRYTQNGTFTAPTEIYLPSAPKSIDCDGQYTVEPIEGCDAAILKIMTGTGKHKVTVKY